MLSGERLPVELGCEAFTLKMLDAAIDTTPVESAAREHITHALYQYVPPAAPKGRTWTIDTQQDLDNARAELAGDRKAKDDGAPAPAVPARRTRKTSA